MLYITEDHVRTAIDRVGGPTKAANLASVSNATIHNWLKAGRIPNIDKARVVAKAADMDVQLLRATR
jgi:predicted site-specific integrase-resolvase